MILVAGSAESPARLSRRISPISPLLAAKEASREGVADPSTTQAPSRAPRRYAVSLA